MNSEELRSKYRSIGARDIRYLGKWNGGDVYIGIFDRKYVGIPQVVILKKGKAIEPPLEECFNILNKLSKGNTRTD